MDPWEASKLFRCHTVLRKCWKCCQRIGSNCSKCLTVFPPTLQWNQNDWLFQNQFAGNSQYPFPKGMFGGIRTRSERRVHRVDQIFYVHTFPQMVSFFMIAFSVTLNVHSNEAEIPRALARKSPGLWYKQIHFEMVKMRLWWCCVCLVKKRQSALQQSFHANLIFRRVMNKEDFFFCWRVSLLTDVPPPPLFVKRFPRSEFGSLKNGSRVRVEDWFYIS